MLHFQMTECWFALNKTNPAHLVGGHEAIINLDDGFVCRCLLYDGAAQVQVVICQDLQPAATSSTTSLISLFLFISKDCIAF